jgi:hypothetical protein
MSGGAADPYTHFFKTDRFRRSRPQGQREKFLDTVLERVSAGSIWDFRAPKSVTTTTTTTSRARIRAPGKRRDRPLRSRFGGRRPIGFTAAAHLVRYHKETHDASQSPARAAHGR